MRAPRLSLARAASCVIVLLAALLYPVAASAAVQEAAPDTTGGEAASYAAPPEAAPDTTATLPARFTDEAPREGVPVTSPPLPVPEKRPVHQFRLGAGATAFAWDDAAAAEDGVLAEFEVERDLAPFLAARAAMGFGTTEFGAAEASEPPLETRLYLPEVSLLLHPPVGPFRVGTFVPYALVGFGSLITDPKRDGLGARSQNALAYGAGARVGFGGRWGLRGEVRRYLIKLEDPLDPSSRESESIHTTRVGGGLTYAF